MYAADVKKEAAERGWDAIELTKRTGLRPKSVLAILEGPDYLKLGSAKEKLFTDIFTWNINRKELKAFDAITYTAFSYVVCMRAVRDYCELKEGAALENADSNFKELRNFFRGDTFALLAPNVDETALLEQLDNNKEARLSILRMLDEEDGRRKKLGNE